MGELVGFHERGVTFRDGSAVDADAVVWCTGFADKNYRDIAAGILGGGNGAVAQETNRTSGDPSGGNNDDEDDVLGPYEIARRIDATWGLDAEGEIRGLAKRHSRIESYWAFGGSANISRWYSKLLAIQIKAELEGVIPTPYLRTPGH
ncbi:hypothetical protein PG990_002492 [Apiospora arundinis]